MTPERKNIYEAALKTKLPAEKLRALADAFEKEGLKEEAEMLRKRAALRDAPPNVKKDRRIAYKKGITSKDPAAVEQLAGAFQKMGATSAALNLKRYAAGLRKTAK